jgi:ribonuclease BN (tRNA processing enzyme)
MNPHFSPIYTLKNMGATLEIAAVGEGEMFRVGDLEISGRLNPHGTAQALAYRIEQEGRSLVYASDAGYPTGGPAPEMVEHYRGADILIHDCTYTPEHRIKRIDRGFSSIACAADAATTARVKHLVMFHYDQDYSDVEVDALRSRCRTLLDDLGGRAIKLTAAREGLTLAV